MALVTYMLARVYNKPIVGLADRAGALVLLPGLVTLEQFAHSPIRAS